jgi:transposase-like protein
MSRVEVRQKWQAILADYECSSLSITEYCRQQEINATSFYQWRKKLKVDKQGYFLPVVVEIAAKPVQVCFANGAIIEVQEDSNPVALRLAVSALS